MFIALKKKVPHSGLSYRHRGLIFCKFKYKSELGSFEPDGRLIQRRIKPVVFK